MRRLDPLVLLTLLGLVASAAVATLHPTERFDPARSDEQVGRTVHVRLVVLDSVEGDDWWRGQASPASAPGQVVPWVWFRPPAATALPGDRIDGRAVVERDRDGIGLVFDGTTAAAVAPGPTPVPVHWDDLMDAPARYAGRLLEVNGLVVGSMLFDGSGIERCHVTEAATPPLSGRLLVRIEPSLPRLGWHCRVEGSVP